MGDGAVYRGEWRFGVGLGQQLGVRKPEIAQSFGIRFDESVFLDDSELTVHAHH